MWNPNKLKVAIDITTKCNAGCPQCHRTDINGCGTREDLPDITWSLKDFKQAYPPEVIKNMVNAHICGTWGDPVTNNELPNMISYIKESSSDCWITLSTNGSLRNKRWWTKLGKIGGHKLNVVFAVEGITQEMHELYRRFTFLDKILENMKAISRTNARVYTQTLIYKHNEDFLLDIERLCFANGSTKHIYLTTDRWKGKDSLTYTVKGKEYVLEKSDYRV